MLQKRRKHLYETIVFKDSNPCQGTSMSEIKRTSIHPTFVYSCQFFIGRITFGNSIVRFPIPQICAISSCSPRDCFQSAVRVRYAVLDSPSGIFTHISKSFVRAHPLAFHTLISKGAVRVRFAVLGSPSSFIYNPFGAC